jgi:hypothetical protein
VFYAYALLPMAVRQLSDLFDKITLHDAPRCVVDSASRWPEVATVARNKILAEFRGMLRNFEKF